MYRACMVTSLVFLMAAEVSSSQQPELSVDLSTHRSLAEAVRQLRERTGWLISVEEPIWPAVAQRTASSLTDQAGNLVQPPASDNIHATFPTLRGPGARATAVKNLVDAYNQQNRAIAVRSLILDSYTVIAPSTISAAGKNPTAARSILSAIVTVPSAVRTPSQHMEALAQGISAQVGVPVDLDTAAFGFRLDGAYLGDPDGGKLEWGTNGTDARTALAGFLEQSKTSTVWQVDCQAGVGASQGRCILSLIPLTVVVKDRSGNITRKTLYYDRGAGPKVPFPPPPPPKR